VSPGACGHLPSFRGSAPVANGVRRSLEAQAERWLCRTDESVYAHVFIELRALTIKALERGNHGL